MKVPYFLLLLTFSLVAFSQTDAQQRLRDSDYHTAQSYKYERQKKYSLAIKSMGVQNKKQYFYHLRLGWLLFLDQKYRNSINHYVEALKLKPNSVNAAQGKVNALIALGLEDDAVNALQKLHKKNNVNLQISMMLAKLLIKKGKTYDAYVVALQAYENYPENLIVLKSLMKSTQILGLKDYSLYKMEFELIVPPEKMP